MKTRDRKGMQLLYVLAHHLREDILAVLNERTASPTELSQQLRAKRNLVSYHVRVLAKYRCIEQVGTRKVNGGTEHFYQATAKAFLDDDLWPTIPKSLREAVAADVIQQIMSDAIDAAKAGTVDAHEDCHLSLTQGILDRKGLKETMESLLATQKEFEAIKKRSKRRLGGEKEGIPVSVSLLGYEAPREARKIGPPKGVH